MNKTTTIYIASLLILSATLAACAGMNVGDFVQVKTPHAIQQQTGLPARLTLNEAEAEYRAWYQDVQREGAAWKASIGQGSEVASLLNQLTLQALNDVGPSLAGVPVLGPILPVLMGIGGLFLRRPGDVSQDVLRKEKEDSYNAGLERAKA